MVVPPRHHPIAASFCCFCQPVGVDQQQVLLSFYYFSSLHRQRRPRRPQGKEEEEEEEEKRDNCRGNCRCSNDDLHHGQFSNTMRWFRKGSEDNAPRLISLSPLRPTANGLPDAAGGADFSPPPTSSAVGAGWSYQRTNNNDAAAATVITGLPPIYHRRSKSALAPAALPSSHLDIDDMELTAINCQSELQQQQQQQQQHSHLPCTLKRKPAVRRRSGGKG